MGSFSIWHWLIVLAVVVVLFGGGGKLSQLMGDVGKGMKIFKRNIRDDTSDQLNHETTAQHGETQNKGSTPS